MRFQRLLTYVLILSMALPLPAQFGGGKPPPLAASSSWGFTLFPFSLVLIPLLIAWMVDYTSRPSDIESERRRRVDPVLIALTALVVLSVVSCVLNHADYRAASMWLSLTGLYAFARYRMPRIIGREQLAVALACVLVGLALLSGVQVLTGRAVGAVATFFQKQVRTSQVYGGNGGGGLFKRVQGTFFSTDVFAMFLLYNAIWLIGVTRSVKGRLIAWSLGLCGVLIALTFSRGVWATSLVVVPLILLTFVRRRLMRLSRLLGFFLVLIVVAGLAFVLAAGTIFARLQATQVSTSAQTRDTANQVAICLIEVRPLWGVGANAMVVQQHIGNCDRFGNDIRAHNIYLQDWAEQGIFVLLAYLAVGLLMIREAVRKRRLDDVGARSMRTSVVFMVIAWLFFMLVYATANDYNVMPIWILLGGYSLTMLDTSRKVVEPLGRAAPFALSALRPPEYAHV
ncbi:MAG TPA: O-antigen ligase family protein [Acidimicrobiia bacterium]|nr:O-antigen ligase family protein [Acidimicrobiia bacterium]